MKRRIVLILIILVVVLMITGGVYWYIKKRGPSTLLSRADVAMRAGNLDKAAELAGRFIETYPDDWRGYHLLADVYIRQGRYEEARNRLEELQVQEQALNPDMYLVLVLLAKTYSHPATESLKTAEPTTRIEVLEAAIEQIRKGNEILSGIETAEGQRALEVQQGIAMNKAFMGEFLSRIANRYMDEAEIASVAGDAAQSQKLRKQHADALQESQNETQDALRLFLAVVSQDASRSKAARPLVQLSFEHGDDATREATRKVILDAENVDPIAKMMYLVHELMSSYEQGVYVEIDSEAQKAEIRKVAQDLDELLEQNPDEEQILIQRAQLAWQLSDISTAESLIEKVLTQNPRQAHARLLEAKIHLARGEAVEAERKLFSLKAEYSRWPEAHLAFGEVAMAAGKTELALQAMRRVTELDPDNSKARRFMAKSLLNEGFFGQAFMDARAYYEAHPEDPTALLLYVESAVRTNQMEKAQNALNKAQAEYASNPTLMYATAEGYGRIGDKEHMLASAQLAADSSPSTLQDRLSVAKAMVLLGRTAEAEKLLTEELARESQHPRLNYILGQIFAKTGRNLQAIERLREAVRLDNDNEGYRLSLARVFLNIGEVDECQNILDGISSTNADANFLRLQIKLIQGKPIDSAEALEQVGSSGSLGIALAYLNSGKPDECIAICERELTMNPADADLRGLLGQAYLAVGQQEKCYEQWKKLLELSPDQLVNYYRLARLLIRDNPVLEVTSKLATISDSKPELIELTKGWLYERTGNAASALEVYKQLSGRSDISDAIRNQSRMAIAGILTRQRNWKEAIAVLDQVSRDGIYEKRADVLKSRLLIANQQLPQAELLLETLRADAKEKRNSAVLRQVAESYVTVKKIDRALAVCDDLESLLPKDPDTYMLRASVLTEFDRQAEAVRSYRKAINCQPGRLGIYRKLVQALDNWQEPRQALAVLDELENLNQAGRSAALFERGILFNRWGLHAQAVACYEQLAASGHGDNPKIRLYLGRTLARLGRKDKASEMLQAIPNYAAEYSAAQLLLADLVNTTEEKLNILQRLETTEGFSLRVLISWMKVLLQAERADEALTRFRTFLNDYPETQPLPARIRPLALQAILHAADQETAVALVRDLARRQGHQIWLFVAVLLTADTQPEAAAKLLPGDVSSGRLYDALLGVYLAGRTANPEASQRWFNRIAQIDEQLSKQEPPGRIPSSYKILVHLTMGETSQAQSELAQFSGDRVIDKSVASELVGYAVANDKAGRTEAGELLKAFVAFDLTVMKLSRAWALDLLKNRPSCQWAASLLLASGVDKTTLGEVHEILQPKDSFLARKIEAKYLMQTKQFAQAASLYGQLAQEQQDQTSFLLQQGTALENAGQFAEGLNIYRGVWESSKNPIAANNAAYLVSELTPRDKEKLTEAKRWIDQAVSVSGGVWAFRDTKGWISYLQGNQDEACKELRRVVKGLPDSVEVHYHLGVVEAAQANNILARWHLEAAKQIGQKTRVKLYRRRRSKRSSELGKP